MTLEEKFDAFVEEYRKTLKEDRRQATIDRYHNVMYWSWGFALATTSLAVASVNKAATILSIAEAVAFVVIATGYMLRARSVK